MKSHFCQKITKERERENNCYMVDLLSKDYEKLSTGLVHIAKIALQKWKRKPQLADRFLVWRCELKLSLISVDTQSTVAIGVDNYHQPLWLRTNIISVYTRKMKSVTCQNWNGALQVARANLNGICKLLEQAANQYWNIALYWYATFQSRAKKNIRYEGKRTLLLLTESLYLSN